MNNEESVRPARKQMNHAVIEKLKTEISELRVKLHQAQEEIISTWGELTKAEEAHDSMSQMYLQQLERCQGIIADLRRPYWRRVVEEIEIARGICIRRWWRGC